MKVLLTCYALKHHMGLELYHRDLALELQRQGHQPSVYASILGPVADDLLAAGIPVTNQLRSLPDTPDIIQGSSRKDTLAALLRFPSVPALFVCHTHAGWIGGAPFHPRIRRYLGVSQLCVDRLREDKLPEDLIGLTSNWVDLDRFYARPSLPVRPKRALLFSNYAHASTQLPAVSEACRLAGLKLDVVGAGVGAALTHPEEVLGNYDIVFAKARAAMEAMAVGTAVVLCDYGGVGPMVTASEFERLRPMNFGFQALHAPLTSENVLQQIHRYDAVDAAAVQTMLRRSAALDVTVVRLVSLYQNVLQEYVPLAASNTNRATLRTYASLIRDTILEKLMVRWLDLPLGRRALILRIPGMRVIRPLLTKLLFRPKPDRV